MSKHNYNILAMSGQDVTDEEYVAEFGLDPTVAGTPRINDAMLDKVHALNIQAETDAGKSLEEATRFADKQRIEARKMVKKVARKAGGKYANKGRGS